jgi:hypothetical protein
MKGNNEEEVYYGMEKKEKKGKEKMMQLWRGFAEQIIQIHIMSLCSKSHLIMICKTKDHITIRWACDPLIPCFSHPGSFPESFN